MYCSQCGTKLEEDQEACPLCFAQVKERKRGFWRRLLGFFGTPVSLTTTVIRKEKKIEKVVILDAKTGKPVDLERLKDKDGGLTLKVFSSFDQMPPELKAQLEQDPELKAKFEQARGEAVTASWSFTFRSPDGQDQTYHSLEEMPPEVRAIYDQVVLPEIRGDIEKGNGEEASPNDPSADR